MVFDPVSVPLNAQDRRFFERNIDGEQPGRIISDPRGVTYQHHAEFATRCRERIVNGVATSGMGDIFRVLGGVNRFCAAGLQ